MLEEDLLIHKICIASIKRNTFLDKEFKWTEFYELIKGGVFSCKEFEKELMSSEIPICSTIINKNNWTLLTTKRILTCEEGELKEKPTTNIVWMKVGDFKGYSGAEFI